MADPKPLRFVPDFGITGPYTRAQRRYARPYIVALCILAGSAVVLGIFFTLTT